MSVWGSYLPMKAMPTKRRKRYVCRYVCKKNRRQIDRYIVFVLTVGWIDSVVR